MAPIEVEGLTKTYGKLVANDDLSLAVESGEIFGYLGPNGAGKTTTIRTLLGLQSPTAGTARVLGADIRDAAALVSARSEIGFLPANPTFDRDVTGRAILEMHANVKGDSALDQTLDRFDPPLDRPVREYSSGNVQKLGLVQALMHDPDLLVLDEPTTGLDPLMQRRFNAALQEFVASGGTVFFSSHVLSEVRRVCDRVGILRDGQLVTVETVDTLLRRSGKRISVRVTGPTAAEALPPESHDVTVTEVDDGIASREIAFTYTGPIDALLATLSGWDVVDLAVEEAPLEDVIMRYYDGERDA